MHTVKKVCQTVMYKIKFEYPIIMTKETETQIYFLAAVTRSQVHLYTPEDFHSTILLVKVKVKRISLECKLSPSLSYIMYKLVASTVRGSRASHSACFYPYQALSLVDQQAISDIYCTINLHVCLHYDNLFPHITACK